MDIVDRLIAIAGDPYRWEGGMVGCVCVVCVWGGDRGQERCGEEEGRVGGGWKGRWRSGEREIDREVGSIRS